MPAGTPPSGGFGVESTEEAENLVIATPERVSFRYEVAGLGSRFLAQLLDVLILGVLMVMVALLAVGIAAATGSGQAAILVLVLLGFAVLVGYFILSEAVWSGQTLGKKALRIRVVGDSGEPITAGQAAIRNLVRIVDFLPTYYGLGVLSIFISKRGKRLGDLAAGTVVVKDGRGVTLKSLIAGAQSPAPAVAAPTGAVRHHLDPKLRRFVAAYAGRRPQLSGERRYELAAAVEPALRQVLPDLVQAKGALAALDLLADES